VSRSTALILELAPELARTNRGRLGPVTSNRSFAAHVNEAIAASASAVTSRVVRWGGWTLVCWITLFWRLGYPSFWDPDEAHYAETTREMLAAHNWFVPTFNGQPFFDKPFLFHTLQMISFTLFGANELAARLVPAVAALALIGTTAWLGTELLGVEVAELGALMLAVMPAMFALSAYAIVDMAFSAFVFGGVSLIAVAALKHRPGLQYPGYLLLAFAVLTKGPLALVLTGLAFGLSLIFAPTARNRLFALRWEVGLCGILLVSAPWFIWMWLRYGHAFVDGYVLRENLWLYARPLYDRRPRYFYYLPVLATGLLPWTLILVGRAVDYLRGIRSAEAERLLWAWVVAVVGFFSFSLFKYDHYAFPAAPALCLLTAHSWHQVRGAPSLRPYAGAAIGCFSAGAMMIVVGALLVPVIPGLPLELPRLALLVPISLIVGGLVTTVGVVRHRWHMPAIPVGIVAGFLAAYAVIVMVGFPAFERAKPVKAIAQFVATTAEPTDRIASYRLNRWTNSWRFYVERPSLFLDDPRDLQQFFQQPGRAYCAMFESDYRQLAHEDLSLRIVYRREGLFVTTGRGLRQKHPQGWRTFVVITNQ
jgi:4-amino-4-deoxy-L-arabinose transferase-like glycosyltransferase